mmetsp:Transcript_53149/g.170289  ORF Transcript_53149/g.170289 Transcript_53149/m.170289 type:complete len:216 (-) Transcript_53149:794-1441(-)
MPPQRHRCGRRSGRAQRAGRAARRLRERRAGPPLCGRARRAPRASARPPSAAGPARLATTPKRPRRCRARQSCQWPVLPCWVLRHLCCSSVLSGPPPRVLRPQWLTPRWPAWHHPRCPPRRRAPGYGVGDPAHDLWRVQPPCWARHCGRRAPRSRGWPNRGLWTAAPCRPAPAGHPARNPRCRPCPHGGRRGRAGAGAGARARVGTDAHAGQCAC